MAILLDTDWGGPFYDAISFEYCSRKDAEPLERYKQECEQRLRELDFQRFKEKKHPFEMRWVEYPRWADHVPNRIRLTKGVALPDYVHDSGFGMLASETLKGLIEDVEPPGAGFSLFPIDVYLPDNSLYQEQYYVWDVFRKVDAIDPSSKGVKSVGGPVDGHHSWTYTAGGVKRTRETLAVKRDVIAGMAAWNDIRMSNGGCFIADALFNKMQFHALTGFSPRSEWSEV
ncbi:imm11 family protein [Actibacterium lipolyticum]|uniref:Immunity MXAN-0049 protein domain-containing protein n=1 Tax=Actibacterium lipolyticum TaxID=1524263 RepID=A0A238JL73_9RHOB|nr:DUF1629 domain-containing protein [Actibacterium lipolyticum]SMX31419.1 hypothetical protein COL8621_00437 [Actibacterium lipolyticum]